MTGFDEGQLHAALQHEQALRRLARGLLRDPAAAEEATQHALLQAAAGRRTAGAGLWPFLATTLRRYAANLHKLAGRRTRHERLAARPDAGGAANAVDDLLAREQLRRRVADAVLVLDEPYRTTVWLRWFEDLTPAAIAAHQGVPVATVRTRLQRAHAQLRRRLDAEFGDRRWASLATLPWGAAAIPIGTGAVVMAKKPGVVVLAAAIIAVAFTVPLIVPPSGPPTAAEPGIVRRETSGLDGAVPAAPPDERAAASPIAPPVVADTKPMTTVRLVHADGRPAAGFVVHWWSAGQRPGWTERQERAYVRPAWPAGMGPGRWSDPWPQRDNVVSTDGGDVVIPATARPVAVSVLLTDGLYYSTAWEPAPTLALPALAHVDLALDPSGGEVAANLRWRGACLRAWREGGEDWNHGYCCVDVDTTTGPGVVRWDRIPFASDAAQRGRVLVLAGHPCAIEAEGIGGRLAPAVAFTTAPAAVTFRCQALVPQLAVEVVGADGTVAPVRGHVWLHGGHESRSELLTDGRASLDRAPDGGAPFPTLTCVLTDGRTLVATAPQQDPARAAIVRLSLPDAIPPVGVAAGAGTGSAADLGAHGNTVWIDVGGTFAAASAPGPLPPAASGCCLVAGEQLLLACQGTSWRSGCVLTAGGRVATFRRPHDGETAIATWLENGAPRTIDVPALSREFGTLPAFAVRLEIEVRTDDGKGQWLPWRSYRRFLQDDHPQPELPWTDVRVPAGWRTRLVISGGLTDGAIRLIEQRLLP